ncbi:hypothetical protein BGX38DRAFT_567898 [Terfezia claveryi]|nr:hypothetical protein BGX38DRAFT_567898 [Terfezia claveryi]
MTPEETQARIYGILQTHDIPLTKEDLSWAFTQDKTATDVIEYTERYLGEECFLGLEEAEIYEHIKATHLLKLHKSRDLGLVYTPSDEELRVEIEMLKGSTLGYQRQTEILRRQKEVLEGMKRREQGVKEARGKLREKRKRKWIAERERVGVDIENLMVTLRHQLNDLMTGGKLGGAEAEAMGAGLVDLKSMKSLLASDDKAIEKLERLAEETSMEELETNKEGDIVEKVRKMTVKLANLMTAIVMHRLDRTYFEAYSGEHLPEEGNLPEQDAYIAVLKADLESLEAEIPDVAKMSAEAEFLRPVVGEVQKRKGMLEEVVSGRGTYIRDVLLQLQARNQHIIHFFEKDLYRRKTLKELSNQLETLAKSPLPQPRYRNAAGDKSSTPPPQGDNSASKFALTRTPSGRASASPTKHLPVHLRRAAAQPSSASAVPPSTPKRTTGRTEMGSMMEKSQRLR